MEVTWKSTAGAFLIGIGAGYAMAVPKNEFWNQDVQIFGGVTMSTPVADIWGYADDWDGCLRLAAGANWINRQELTMPQTEWRELISKWAADGSTTCQRSR